MTRDRGSAATEMVLLTPVLVLMLLLVVHGGRAAGAMNMVRHAADEGARAASLVSVRAMSSAALAAVNDDLADDGGSCVDLRVDTYYMPARPGSVTVTVSCRVDDHDVASLGLVSRRVTASSTEVVDIYRGGD